MSVQITEKMKINNQIVLMRKHVKQAKVHSINKLVKEVKLLQYRKGNEVQVAKAKRKAERFLEEINILKKIKPDHVSKLTLSKIKDWKVVLQERTSSLEDRCLAKLATYDAVQKEVEKFHSTNPDLVSKIPDLVKEWEQKSKFPKRLPNKRKKNLDEIVTKDKHLSGTLKKEVDENIPHPQIGNESDCGNEDIEFSFSSKEVKDDVPTNKVCKVGKMENFTGVENDEASENIKVNQLSAYEFDSDGGIASDQDMEEGDDTGEDESEAGDSESTDNDRDDSLENKTKVGKCAKQTVSDDENSKISQKFLKKRKLSDYKRACEENVPCSKVSRTQNSNISTSPMTLSSSQCNQPVPNAKISTEKNLKTIAMINLDDLQGFDEIPIDKTVEDEKESEEDEDSRGILREMDSEKKISDPFFLGRDEVESASEDMLSCSSGNIRSPFKRENDNTRERSKFGKNEKSNFRNKQDYQKSSSQFSGKEFNKFSDLNKFNSEKSFKRNFQPNNQDRFPDKRRNKFPAKDPKDFNRRERRRFLASGKNPFEEPQKKSHFKSEGNNSFKREKMSGRKGNDASAKPLHPSWEAKKKQKELAQTTFQGKRMVFNN